MTHHSDSNYEDTENDVISMLNVLTDTSSDMLDSFHILDLV